MVNYELHKKVFERMLEHTCNIYGYENIFDEDTKQTISKEVLKFENLPCRLSSEASTTGSEKTIKSDEYNSVLKNIKLFLKANTNIDSGAKVVVNYNGQSGVYINASAPVFYPTHTEVCLMLDKERA